jgi:hypothetical protein
MVTTMRWLMALVVVSACSRVPPSSPLARSEVVEVAAPPEGYVTGESLTETCRSLVSVELEEESLSDVDCSYSRLSRALQARAGEQGVRYLVGKRCRRDAGARPVLTCTAALARATEKVPLAAGPTPRTGPAPSPEQVRDLDEPRPQEAARIRVSYRPALRGAPPLPAREYDRVEETSRASVGRRALGQVSARCVKGCEEASLRHALRITAGRVGAGELSGVACFAEGKGARCVATALVPWSS